MSKTDLAKLGAALTCVALFGTASAAETPEGWSGEAELGMVFTSGNTSTRSLNAKALARHKREKWLNTVQAEMLKSSDNGAATAERYLAQGKTSYHYSERNYSYATLRYEDDRFSGYDYQVSESIGGGHRLVKHDDLNVDVEAGIGGRHSKPTGASRQNEAILRGAAALNWQVSPTAVFTENLLVESGRDNTYSESISALKVKVNGSLAMKVSVTVKHNSSVPAGSKRTDTISAATLVYDF